MVPANERENAFFDEEFNYPACELLTHFSAHYDLVYPSSLSSFAFFPFDLVCPIFLLFSLAAIRSVVGPDDDNDGDDGHAGEDRRVRGARFSAITFTCPCRLELIVHVRSRMADFGAASAHTLAIF